MVCSNCGSVVADDARFCSSCGQPVRAHTDERRVVTVVFADLVGYTALSESLDPEAVKRLVDRAFEKLVGDVSAFGGRVDKIVGDAIVALFGAPVAHEDDAERAVRAALRMQESLAEHAADVGADIRMRIGVNTGEVLVGALRAGGDYTAMGDVVNTASRLQTASRPGDVLVGETTYQVTRDAIEYEACEPLVAKGKEQPLSVWIARRAARPPGYRTRRPRTPLVGRNAEMAVLENTIDVSFRHRRAQMVLLLGEAGVGKTRLAGEIAPMVGEASEDALVLNGRCVPYGEANPWWPIAEALRAGCGIGLDEPLDEAREATRRAALAVLPADADTGSIVNGLLHLMGYEGPLRGLDPTRAREEATQSLLSFMEASVRARPIVIRLADLHWADDLVLELIDRLSAQLAREPFVLVATARRGLLRRWSPRAGRHNVLILNVDPLDRGAASTLLDALVDGQEVSTELREMLLDRSGGNPFFLEELVTLLTDRTAGSASTPELPDTLRGLLAARIDGLTTEEQLVLEDAAVWGSSGPLEALDRLAEATRGTSDVSAVAQSLHDKEILNLDVGTWSFRSDLIREVAYARLTKLERLRRHHGIASYLEVAVGGRFIDDSFVDTVARHFIEAARLAHDVGAGTEPPDGVDAAALRWQSEAARRADQSAAWPLAARLYTQGLELLDLMGGEVSPTGERRSTAEPRGDHRLIFLLGRAHARSEMWRFDEARADADAALACAEAADDAAGRAQALLRRGEIASKSGDRDLAEAELGAALAAFDALGDLHGRAETLRLTGMARLFADAHQAAEAPIADALEAFRAVGDRRGEAWALQNLAWISFTTGHVGDADRRLDKSSAAFAEIGDSAGMAWTLGLRAFVRFYQGRLDEAAELSERILHESERRGDRWGQAMMLIIVAAVDLWGGRTREAADTASRSAALFRSLGDVVGLEQVLSLEGRARAMAGDVAAGRAILDEAQAAVTDHVSDSPIALAGVSRLALEVQLGQPVVLTDEQLATVDAIDAERVGQADILIGAALASAQRGDATRAEEYVGRALSHDPDNGFAQAAGALVAAAAGRVEEVQALTRRLIANSRATYLDRIQGWVAVGLVDPASTDAAFESARRELASTGDELGLAFVTLAEATSQTMRRHPEAATTRAEAARRWALLGVDPVGWRRVFDAAVAASSDAATDG